MAHNPYLDALRTPGLKWTQPVITYFFADKGVSDSEFDWDNHDRSAFRGALQEWANVADLKFKEVQSTNANMVERLKSTIPGGHASHSMPEAGGYDSGGRTRGSYWHEWDAWTNLSLKSGGNAFSAMLHELGHALGLAHPFVDNKVPGSPAFPGVADRNDSGDNNLHTSHYTVMAYIKGQYVPGNQNTYGQPATPMAFDIAAVQSLYGRNNSYRKGDTTYDLPGANVAGTGWRCIWDSDGNDTIRYAGPLDAKIDLTAATLDNSPSGGGVLSKAEGILGGFTIANGVVIENAQSGSGADTLTGNSAGNRLRAGSGADDLDGRRGHDVLNGQAGNDRLWGRDGNDLMIGGGGRDLLLGGTGKDQMFGDADNDRLLGGTGDDILFGGDGADVMQGNHGRDTLDGNTGDDTLSGDDGNDKLLGGAGRDRLMGKADDDLLKGQAQDDQLYGGTGRDRLFGGSGQDLLKGDAGHDSLQGDAGKDRLWGGSGDDNLLGGAGDDRLFGSTGLDTLSGGGGDDHLDGGTGKDSFDGGAGRDLVDYSAETRAVTVNLGSGKAKITGLFSESVKNVEDLLLGSGHDWITGDGGRNRLNGGNGDDRMDGRNGADILLGGAGDDTLTGGGGQDYLDGGAGADTADWTSSSVTSQIDLGAGTATFTGYYTEQVLNMEHANLGSARDVLTGNGAANRVNGNDGNDTLDGKGGADRLYGGNGLDFLLGDAGNDLLNGGNDDDWLDGGSGADRLKGGDGHDNLDGGPGDDKQWGGNGRDTFVFSSGDGIDLIYDFEDGVDVLRINDSLWGGGKTRDQVVQDHATVIDTDLVFNFAGGEKLTLTGFGALGRDAIVDDIVII